MTILMFSSEEMYDLMLLSNDQVNEKNEEQLLLNFGPIPVINAPHQEVRDGFRDLMHSDSIL
jgi:hypothetical protein